MVVCVRLSTMSDCIVCWDTMVISGEDVCCSVVFGLIVTIITKILIINNCFYITDITAVIYSNITSIPIFCLSYDNII